MKDKYREQRTHGSPLFQLQVYSHRDHNGFYLVPYHWHDEIEIIYVEELHRRIGPEQYIFFGERPDLFR